MISEKKDSRQGDEKGRGDNGEGGYGSEKSLKWYVRTGDRVGVWE